MNQEISATYDKKISCPLCNHKYTSKKLRSRAIRVEKIENDNFTIYKESQNNPTLYEVYVCPDCGFAFTDQFTTSFSESEVELFRKSVTARWEGLDYGTERSYQDAVNTYKLALLSSNITNQPAIVIAGICLRLSWVLRYKEEQEEENRFLKNAIQKYELSYENGDFKSTKMSEVKLLFLMGAISRRLGLLDKAVVYLSKIIEHKDRHLEPTIVEKAREEWYAARKK
ncbi:DUF2225 domain-containing protein [Evansella cellulosilytica]|uniref:DUF2225 domain-containing protein n=1 Tax=Evansella cellulosilytica (strain ATCC 21833 / DSM 2522 / FERM P-1141 / JCM 9156 / N-4) TaxID=649639 RepID=E6TTK9_EVAC2|nr:DUF2225 domain-containing protein [Evansella cellulosilytica]ADU29645.1 Protein of unknown function DUF2225 [Evansella cellulosilytica DSM 2522]